MGAPVHGSSLVRLAVVLAAVAAESAFDVAPAAAEFPGRAGRIFFTTPNRPDFPPACGAASVSPDGTAYECVDPFGFDPSASPDGRLIVEERPGMPVPIFTVKADGTGARRVTHERTADSEAPTFSPDGRRILYFQSGGEADGAYVMNADGSGQARLTPDAGFGPVFSPSGTQFASFGRGITVANADGSGSNLVAADVHTSTADPTTLTVDRTNIVNSEPNWSPDGRRIAFTRESTTSSQTCDLTTGQCNTNEDHQIDVYVMNADGSGLRQLTSTRAVNEEEPSWSPDGRQIAYFRMPEANADGVGEIWVMNADGTGQRAIARGWHPHWSTVQGGPGRPRLRLEQVKRNKRSTCLGIFDFFRASVITTASKRTLFDLSISIDGREVEQEFDTRDLSAGMDTVRPGRHRLTVVMTSHAIHDTVVRSLKFRRCRGGHL
jgi:hypothetical protein